VVLDNSFRKQYTRRCGNGNRSGASRLWNSVICDSQENTQYPVLNTQHSDAKSNATTVEPGSREEITTPMGLRIWKRRVQKATIQIDSSENFTKTSLIPTKYLQKTDKK